MTKFKEGQTVDFVFGNHIKRGKIESLEFEGKMLCGAYIILSSDLKKVAYIPKYDIFITQTEPVEGSQ